MEVLTALANEISTNGHGVKTAARASSLEAKSLDAKPILQLNPFPTTLNTDLYKNPLSSLNPNGDIRSLFRFRQLVDPIPHLNRFYSASSGSTQNIYEEIVGGAAAPLSSSFSTQVIHDAQKKLKENAFERMDGLSGSWCPIYASPQDWYEAKIDRFKNITLDDLKGGDNYSSFNLLGGEENLKLQAGTKTCTLSKDTTIHSIEMKYLLVSFRRPWFNSILFDMNDWFLAGQGAGFCSSGNLEVNTGVLPLIPTGMIIGKEVSVNADWSKNDNAFLQGVKSTKEEVFLGPFRASSTKAADNIVEVIAWISDLIPYSPKMASLPKGNQ